MSVSNSLLNPISVDEQTTLISVAHEMAEAAKKAILPYFRGSNLALENKDAAGFDSVTAADKAAEKAMKTE